MSKRTIALFLSLLVITMMSCTMENGNGNAVEISHNPKNLLSLEKSDYAYYSSFPSREVYMSFTTPLDFGATSTAIA